MRMRSANEALSAVRPAAAAILVRDAVVFLLRACAVARADRAIRDESFHAADSITQLRAALPQCLSIDVERVYPVLAAQDPLDFDSLDDAEVSSVYEALVRCAKSLRRSLDLRSPAYTAGARFGRWASASILALYLLYRLLIATFPAHNLALGRPVHMSSQQPGTPDPAALVDGNKRTSFGAHTAVGSESSWIIIDLERTVLIRKIIIYNRTDTNFDDGLPFGLDLSTDGESFRQIAVRTQAFGLGGSFSPPWTVRLRDNARYIRIRATGYTAINEVEVF